MNDDITASSFTDTKEYKAFERLVLRTISERPMKIREIREALGGWIPSEHWLAFVLYENSDIRRDGVLIVTYHYSPPVKVKPIAHKHSLGKLTGSKKTFPYGAF